MTSDSLIKTLILAYSLHAGRIVNNLQLQRHTLQTTQASYLGPHCQMKIIVDAQLV